MNNYLKLFKLTGKIAVVTGAGEGIGRDIAIDLATAGADVIVCSRREQKLQEVKAEIENLGRKSELFVLDVRNVDEIERLKDFIIERFGKIDILVNNAGYAVTKMAIDTTEEDWDKMLDTGLKGVFFCSQIIGSIMFRQNYGKIINLGSTFSHSTIPGRSVYAALKAGLVHLTESLAVEWAQTGRLDLRHHLSIERSLRFYHRTDIICGRRLGSEGVNLLNLLK